MSGLGLLGAALAGTGKGLGVVAEQQYTRERTAAQVETDRLKEQRVEEAKMATEQRKEQTDIRGENRGLLNEAVKGRITNQLDLEKLKQTHSFATAPTNVQATADAGITAQKAKDAYSDSRFDVTLDQKSKEYAASHPNDAAKDKLEQDKLLAQIDEIKGKTANATVKNKIDGYGKLITGWGNDKEALYDQMRLADDATKEKLQLQINTLNEKIDGLAGHLQTELGIQNDTATDNDPVGVFTKPDKKASAAAGNEGGQAPSGAQATQGGLLKTGMGGSKPEQSQALPPAIQDALHPPKQAPEEMTHPGQMTLGQTQVYDTFGKAQREFLTNSKLNLNTEQMRVLAAMSDNQVALLSKMGKQQLMDYLSGKKLNLSNKVG